MTLEQELKQLIETLIQNPPHKCLIYLDGKINDKNSILYTSGDSLEISKNLITYEKANVGKIHIPLNKVLAVTSETRIGF